MLTLAQTLSRDFRHHGGSTAIIDGDRRLTWREFGARVERRAGVLAALGVRRGDRFAIHALNGPRFEEPRWAGFRHGDVHERAVIGVADARLGEALFAVIVPRPGAAPDEADIIEHRRQRITGYKIPRRMAFVDAMPKSAMGKILKAELRAAYGGG